jgi:hypothetical protein
MKPLSARIDEFIELDPEKEMFPTVVSLRAIRRTLDEWQEMVIDFKQRVEERLGQKGDDPEQLKVRISNLEWMNENLRENNRALLATNESLRDVVAKLSNPTITVGGQ